MKNIIIPIIALSIVAVVSYMLFEPQIMGAASDAVTVTQAVSSALAISDCANFTMSQTIPGVGGGTATGACTWNVKTSNAAGFNMTLLASTDPALRLTATTTFADYTVAASGTPDYTWSVAASASEFGYTVEPATAADTVAKFLDNGSNACGTGATNGTNTCWYNIGTNAYTIINRSSATGASGEDEVMRLQSEVGASKVQTSGNYTATITATVTDN